MGKYLQNDKIRDLRKEGKLLLFWPSLAFKKVRELKFRRKLPHIRLGLYKS